MARVKAFWASKSDSNSPCPQALEIKALGGTTRRLKKARVIPRSNVVSESHLFAELRFT
jgi:hypothetical protein